MEKDILVSLARLSDDDLAAPVKSLAARERDAAAHLIAHLAEMDTRDIHLRAGYPRLYDYCLGVLHLSEWEAWNRIEVARRFPILFDMLEEGSIDLTGIKLLSPRRYKLQLTISGETLQKLRRAKDLLGHSVAAGDDDAVLNRALTVLLDKLARRKCARTDKPRPGRPRNRRARRPSAAVQRVIWERDEGRCRYTSPYGHRCEETRRIEEHHLDPWALGNDADDPDAFELRCQRHNDYEGRLYFGRRRRKGKDDGEVRERPAPYGARSFSAGLVPEQTATSVGVVRRRQRRPDLRSVG
jgi:hypothetical protein